MSYVAAVMVMTGVLDEDDEPRVLADINAFFDPNGPKLSWITDAFSGHKHPQVSIVGAGINYLPVRDFIAHLRSLPWDSYRVGWAQVAIQNEHDDGFGIVDVYRAPHASPAWSPPETP